MIVIDASVTLHAVLPGPGQAIALSEFERWIDRGETLAAPSLWLAECVSGIRMAVYRREIDDASAETLLRELEFLTVQIHSIDFSLCQSALDWARRLRQASAYDAIYLALAERLGVEFWTSDMRLANRVRQLGVEWVKAV